MRLIKIAVVAAFLAATPSAFAQDPGEVVAAAASGSMDENQDQGNPRISLLGLLGLIGLLGRFRREANIHIDARRTPRG